MLLCLCVLSQIMFSLLLKQCTILRQKKNGNVGEMTLKLDMSKAYDRIEWDCLEKIMIEMGFHT